MTITIGWWGLPLVLSLIGIVLTMKGWWGARSSTIEICLIDLTCYNGIAAFGIPWGVYGVVRAIWG